MMEYEKLPFHVRRVIDRCREGETLCVTFQPKEIGDPICYFEPGGKRVGHVSALKATKTDFLRPGGDGLFGAESSQTWTAA